MTLHVSSILVGLSRWMPSVATFPAANPCSGARLVAEVQQDAVDAKAAEVLDGILHVPGLDAQRIRCIRDVNVVPQAAVLDGEFRYQRMALDDRDAKAVVVLAPAQAAT